MNPALSRLIVPGTDADVTASYETLAERAANAVFGFEDEVVIVDIETTGWDPGREAIIEVAAAIMRGPEIVERFHTMVDPGRSLPAEIVKLTGIRDEDLRGAVPPEVAAVRLAEFAAGRDLVAHNAAFDRAFLTRAAGPGTFRGSWIDSLQASRIALPRLRSHRLVDLAAALGVTDGRAHRAEDDVAALAVVWRALLVGMSDLPAGALSRIAVLAPGAPWALRSVIAHVAAARPASAFDLKELRKARVSHARASSLEDAEEVTCTCPPRDEVLAQFAEEGVAGKMYDGFEQRDEQLQMAGAVVDAFATRTHVAIEAGTGVGKSIAYLVPGALFALENGVGVGVATKTNSLMDQLVHGELPALDEAMGGGLRYVSLKGYDHYPCLRKLQRFSDELDDTADEERIATVAAVLAWVAQSGWGDLDSVNVHWNRDVRGGIGASQADCTRKRCRFHPNLCYLHGVRRRAASAHVVVTNHALLFRDVVAQGGILPPIRYWVIDEAHSAESEARKQLTVGASHVELSVVLAALHGKGRGGLLDTLGRDLAKEPEGVSAAEVVLRMRDQVSRCATLADSLFDFVKDLGSVVGETGYDSAEVRVTDELRDSGPWGTVASTGASLARRLEPLIADGRELMTRLEELGADFSEPRADLAGLLSRLVDQHIGLVTVLDGDADEFVYSVSFDRRRTVTPEKLKASRLDVGEVLAEEFFPRSHSVVMTSATIATGDSFEHFARSVGLDRLPRECWRSLRLASSYDFDRQMSVFVPGDIAEPGSRSYLADLEALLEGIHRALGGSVLTLFTNRRDMEALYEALEPRLESHGISLLVQGRGTSAKRLRDEFLADERLSLFATKSFWEGFDAKGDTLRCVVVPKLPFGQLKDPLYEERQFRDPRAWQHYYLPEAVLELKQAAGRLIRSSTDTGCLVIADSRVAGGRKRYARDFLSALPVSDVEILPAERVVDEIERRFGRVLR